MTKRSKVERGFAIGLRVGLGTNALNQWKRMCSKLENGVQEMRSTKENRCWRGFEMLKCIFAYSVLLKKHASHIRVFLIGSHGGDLRVYVCVIDLMTYVNELAN